jgi:hypothetical protein
VCVSFHVLVEACVHGPFPTSIRDEISKKVIENEAYSFTYGFFGYHNIQITKKKIIKKTTYVTEWGSCAYNVMPFNLKNSSIVFSRVVVITF